MNTPLAMQRQLIAIAKLSILLLTVVRGDIIQKPVNMATGLGGQVVFDCSSNDTYGITWLYTTDCNSATGISLTLNNCEMNSNYTAHYRIEKPDGFVCNLVVFDAVISLGGCYLCADGIGMGRQYSAFLVIVASNALLQSNSTDIIHGEDVVISYSVSYGGPTVALQDSLMPPSFYWTLKSDPGQNVTSYPGPTTDTSASSYIVLTAQPPNVPSCICNLFFNPPSNLPINGAANAPTYRTSWETPTYDVSYNLPPNIAAISHFESDICEAKILSCQPDAYPLAEIYWIDLRQGINIYQPQLTAQYLDEYTCVTTNFYRNATHQSESTYFLSDQGQFSQTPCQFADSNKVEIILPSEAQCSNFTCTCPCCADAVLKCYAATIPEAEYKWLFGDTETEGSSIKPMADGNYTCIAYNTVNNQRFSGNKSLSISQFAEFQPSSPATDETTVIVLSVILAVSLVINMGLVTWILCRWLSKERAAPGSMSRGPDDDSSRHTAYENTMKLETLAYQTLELATEASTYQELTPGPNSDVDA